MDNDALSGAFQRRAQQGMGGMSAPSGPSQPQGGGAPANANQASALEKAQPEEAMFILKVLAKRLESLPPHKPEAPKQPQQSPQPAMAQM